MFWRDAAHRSRLFFRVTLHLHFLYNRFWMGITGFWEFCTLYVNFSGFCFTGLGCDKAFCGAYWHSQGVDSTDSHPACDQETLKPVSSTLSFFPPCFGRKSLFKFSVISCNVTLGHSLGFIGENPMKTLV